MDSPLNAAAEGPGDGDSQIKTRTAPLSLASNSVLILLKVVAGSITGSAAIAFQAIRHLVSGEHVQRLGVGIAVVAFSLVVNLIVSSVIGRTRATDSPALEGDAAHLRTDAFTSLAVLVGLALVAVTGAQWLDPVVALLVAASIVVTGLRLLSRSSRVGHRGALGPGAVSIYAPCRGHNPTLERGEASSVRWCCPGRG
jgi:divalent metal cation (Fe/Co/Zn/Cd) transporter